VQVKNPLEGVPRQLTGAIGDIRRIADGMQALPELVSILSTIEGRVESLDEEVRLMRAEVSELKASTADLPEKLEEVGKALHPLRRTLSRFGRGNGDPDVHE
jgi:chromosome segregation ATPase